MKEFERTYAMVDLNAIRHNILEEKRHIRQGTRIMAIVKANAYGHGAVRVAQCLLDLVDAYGVAMIEEALELRRAGIDKTILILGHTGKEWFPEVIEYGISQTVYTADMARQLSDTAQKLGKKAIIHIKIDTGMSRIGFLPTDENVSVVKDICRLPGIEVEGIFTHFARADETSLAPAEEAFCRYMDFVTKLEHEGISIPVKHVANSAAILAFPKAHLDMVRSGITTYGIYPSDEVPQDVLHLQPAMQWKTTISYIKEIEAGTKVSYGGTFTAGRKTTIATIPVGYADGMKRALSNRGRVLIHGQYAPIIGRICMDQFMADITEIPEAKEGDEVTLFGTDGDAVLPIEEAAAGAYSFPYEFLCSITDRVPRKYKS